MRIFLFIRQPSFAKLIMADIAEAVRDLGWEILWMDLEHRVAVHRHRPFAEKERLVRDIVEEVRAFNPHLVFSYGIEYVCPVFEELDPALSRPFHEILGLPAVFFLFDFGSPFLSRELDAEGLRLFERWQSPDFLFFCWDREALSRMKAFGLLKSHYFPMAYNPGVFHRIENCGPHGRRTNILFAGGPTPERILHLSAVCDLGLKIYGYGEEEWAQEPGLRACLHPPITDRALLNRAYNDTKIAVNITRPHGFSSLNMRVYEAMAAGAMMLTDEKSDARLLFEAGNELVTYSTPRELRQKARYYLDHPGERAQIAEAGRRRVARDHTYAARMKANAPLIIDFFKEQQVFDRIEQTASKDPDLALGLLTSDPVKEMVKLNQDHYHYMMARHAARKGDRKLAARCAALVLEINPHHLAASRLAQSLQDPPLTEAPVRGL